jgi:hypothetical protein
VHDEGRQPLLPAFSLPEESLLLRRRNGKVRRRMKEASAREARSDHAGSGSHIAVSILRKTRPIHVATTSLPAPFKGPLHSPLRVAIVAAGGNHICRWGRCRGWREILKLNIMEPMRFGGWGGIRTHGTVSRTPVFKTGSLNHSDTHPAWPCRAFTSFGSRVNRCSQPSGNEGQRNEKEKWCPQQDSNSRPPDYKSGALPTEL